MKAHSYSVGRGSWHDPVSDHWFQETFFSGTKPKFPDLGKLTAAAGSFRSQIDGLTNQESRGAMQKSRPKKMTLTAMAKAAAEESNPDTDSTNAKAKSLRAQIKALKAK